MSKHTVEIDLKVVEFGLDLPACMTITGVSMGDGVLMVEVDSTEDIEYDWVEAVYEPLETGTVELVGFEPL